ncbi:hypothetical protein BBJ29_005771 [Phytophthora kernoviae]|uniref:Kinesin motor domain-containing protein n=1 Tax=Phytophthora kernoviae TaxID=325452 RepID=A0A3F2RH81_9STRA|nr:hypothetical protein BBJ29_005771 [Phytophthora kernoviae]RLN56802.1 hypothetical protein BBP00_00007802 [Phytophthora kernoviae]
MDDSTHYDWTVTYVIVLAVATVTSCATLLLSFKQIKVSDSAVQYLTYSVCRMYFIYTLARLVLYVGVLANFDGLRDTLDSLDNGELMGARTIYSEGKRKPFPVIVTLIGDCALLSTTFFIVTLAYEMKRLIIKSMDRGPSRERAITRQYCIRAYGASVVFAILMVVSAFLPPSPAGTLQTVAFWVELACIWVSVLYPVYATFRISCQKRARSAVDPASLLLHQRIKTFVIVYCVLVFPSCVVEVLIRLVDDIKMEWVGFTQILYYLSGGGTVFAIGISASCCFRTLRPIMPPSVYEQLLEGGFFPEDQRLNGMDVIVEPPTRRPVFVVTDIEGSSRLWSANSPAMAEAQSIHDDLLRQQLPRFRGYEITTCGDSFQLAFHCVCDAIDWCVSVQEKLLKAPWPTSLLKHDNSARVYDIWARLLFNGLRVRMAIHDGDERLVDISSELLDVDDRQLLQQHKQQQQAEGRETVRVTVRFRPLLPREKSKHSAWTVHAETGTVEAATGPDLRRRGVYAFDEVYDAQHSTGAIYDGLARSIARSALDGIHGSIFAYGQTSSGKTHTMQGTSLKGLRNKKALLKEGVETEEDRRPEDSDGLVQLAVKDLFDEMARRSDVEFLVRVSYLEVYNETIRDLLVSGSLNGKPRDSTVHVREHPVTGVFTDNSERVVTDVRSVLQALRDGEKQRSVGVTRMNERSSRSHTIFRVVIESKTCLEAPVPTEDGGMERVRVGCLNFVDLAGSESARAVSSGGKQLTAESGNINRSLLALSRVVAALGCSNPNQKDHINFRDSKLTRILQPSLSGAARVLFVCCASPAPSYVEDTRSTLKFASRAKRIKVNASVNEVVDQRARALMELARENQVLRQQLDALACASRDEMDAMEEYAARLRMRIASLEAAAAASVWASFVVTPPATDVPQKSRENRQPEVTGLEAENSPTTNPQDLDVDLTDGESTDVDSQFDSPTGSPLLIADSACPTCETFDDALEIAKTRELESCLRIEQLEEQVSLLLREREDNNSNADSTDESDEISAVPHCVLDIDDGMDETETLTNSENSTHIIANTSSFTAASVTVLAVVAETLRKCSPTGALAIVVITLTVMGIMLASFVWNIAAAMI